MPLIIHDTGKKVGLKSLLGETWRPALCTPQLLLVTHQESLVSGCYWHLPNEKVSPGCIQLHSAIHGWGDMALNQAADVGDKPAVRREVGASASYKEWLAQGCSEL